MTVWQATTYGTGLVFSVFGTVLWAWNDFGIWLVRSLTDLFRELRSGWDHLLRRLRLRGPRIHVDAGTSVGKMIGFSTGYATLDESASLDDKVAFLLREHGEHETKLQLLERELGSRIDGLRQEIRDDITVAIQRLRSDNIHVRCAGVALVIVGIVLLAVAPFV